MPHSRIIFYSLHAVGLWFLTMTSLHYSDSLFFQVMPLVILFSFMFFILLDLNKDDYHYKKEYYLEDIEEYLNNLSHFADYISLIDKNITEYELKFIRNQFFKIKETLDIKGDLIKKGLEINQLSGWLEKNTSSIHLYDDQIKEEDKISLSQSSSIISIMDAIQDNNFRRALSDIYTFIEKKKNKTISGVERQALGKLFDFYVKRAKEFKYEK